LSFRFPVAALRRAKRNRQLSSAISPCIETLERRTLLSTVIAPTADTYVRNHVYALTNFGASPLLFIKNASSGDSRVSFVKFDLSGVSSVGHAVLQLTAKLQNSLSTPFDAGVYGVSDSSWVEGDGSIVNNVGDGFDTDNSPANEMTWNNEPTVDSNAIATATINRDSFQTYNFDVTSYLQAQLDAGNTVVSFAVEGVEAASQYIQILSRESSGPGNGPALLVTPNQSAPLTADISAPDITSAAPTETVTVTYAGGTGIDTSTIGTDDLTVKGPGGTAPVTGVTFSDNGTSIIAVYTVAAPDGDWSAGDNGPYTVSLAAGSVQDLSGANVPSALGSFRVVVGDSQPPTSAVAASPLTAGGGSTYSFDVTYSDNVAVDVSTITIDNVGVSGPAGTLKVLGVAINPNSNAASVTATYTVQAPNGNWDSTDNGTYLITVRSNEIMDTAGNPTPLNTANFNVAIAVPDTTPPAASIGTEDITTPGGATETVTINYQDNIAIDPASIDVGDISIVGPHGEALSVTGATAGPTDGDPNTGDLTAVYTIAAPGGSWDASDNGTYAISLAAGAVTDTSGNGVAAGSAAFNVSASVVDNSPPTASISAPSVTDAGGGTQTITVTYNDNVAVDASSIADGDISVSGPGGPLTVTGVKFTPNGNAATITATYTVVAPNGAWDATDNGTYIIATNSNQVRDTSGNAVGVTSSSFAVNIPLPNPTDQTFDNGNVVTSPFIAQSVLTEPSGKIIVVGYEVSGSSTQGVIERLNANGTLDSTFGTSGQIVTPGSSSDAWYAVVQQGANHFVVAGTHNNDFSLARFDFDGNLDPTFGAGGTVFTDFGGTRDIAYAVAVGADQTIVAAGASGNHFAVARYDANGHLNSQFGAGGRQIFDTGGAVQVLGAVTIDSQGRVVAAGASDSKLDVIRLTAAGDPDTTFNGGGMLGLSALAARTDSTTPDYTEALTLQGDGKILVANKTSDGHFGVARIKDTGALDGSFSSSGIATANFGGDDDADSIVVQGDTGIILVVGTSLQNGAPNTAVCAFDPSGKLITNFGNSGKITFAETLPPASRELHIGDIFLRAFGATTTGGKLLVGASAGGATTTFSSLRRLIVPGTVGNSIQSTFRGAFGILNGKKTKLVLTDTDGTKITITLTGGQGSATQVGDGGPGTKIRLDITASDPKGCVLSISTHGGDKRASFSDIVITGAVRSMKATTSDISGTLSIGGAAGNVTVGNVSGNITVGGGLGTLKAGAVGGTIAVDGNIHTMKLGDVTGVIAAAGSIHTLSAHSLTGAKVLAGTALGSDNQIGGGGSAADAYAAGTIDSLKISGAIGSSFVGAGIDPVDAAYGNANDTEAGGALSIIGSISAKKGADAASGFEAAAFKSVHIPKKVDPATDPRFRIFA
jgi:uncharacterized delta-60 repeat protein